MTTAAEVQDKTVILNGLRFHYLDWGNAGAPPLVLLHGFTSHAHSWDTFAEAMRDEHHVLALDQRGHGESEWATDYHPLRRVEDLAAFVDALDLDRFDLLGLSMGGRCAYQYAARNPLRVDRLVIVDIAPETAPGGAQRIANGLRSQDVFANPDEAFAVARQANPRPPDDELRKRVTHGLLQRADGTWTFRYDVALRNNSGARVVATPEEIEHDWASLGRISSDTLLVRGLHSDILSEDQAARMVAAIPSCRLVEVADAGHSVPLDNPSGFLQVVRGFLNVG